MEVLHELTLPGLLLYGERRFTDTPALSFVSGQPFTYHEVYLQACRVASYLISTGIKPGDTVALFSENMPHWGITYFGISLSGAVIVPILPDFNDNDTSHIINHSDAKLVIGAKQLLNKILLEKTPNLESIIVLEDFSLHWAKDENVQYKLADSFQYYKENKLEKSGFTFEEWEPKEMCIISYTSGTSGFTKGVMIPERSLVSNIIFAQDHMPLQAGSKIVSFLPMAHVYGLLFEFLFPLSLGCHITFLSKIPSPAIITKVFGEVKPHLVLSVPLVIEKIYKKRLLPTLEKPTIKVLLAIPGISNILLKKIRAKLVDTFGGRFFEIVIGGAPLSADVEKFFKRINFPFTIGYGMTECGPLVSYAAWNKTLPASAGQLVDRMEVRIESEDPYNIVGEIQVKGDNVMLGYFKNEQATKEAFTDDGWLKTGDLGIIDKNNFIFIKGRSKNMLLGPSGQNIYPEEIEAKLSNQKHIAECVVIDRNRKLVALVYPDTESMRVENVDNTELPGIMESNRKKVNAELPKYEQISSIEIVNEEFEKTPKKNIKRFKYT